MQPGKEDFFETLLKVHGIKFVSSYRNAKMKLKTYHQTVTDILLYSQCRQLNHYLPSKYHWWWLHLLLASNKFDSEYTLLSRSINFSSCGKDCEAFMSSYSRTAFSLRNFLRTFISPIFYKKVVSRPVTVHIWENFVVAAFPRYSIIFLIPINLLWSMFITPFSFF